MNENEVISLVRQGNAEAFAEIVENYQAALQRYLYRMTGDTVLAEDLVQDTFIQAYNNLLKSSAEISLRAWLYRIAENNAKQYFRRKKLLFFLDLPDSDGTGRVSGKHDTTELSLEIEESLMKLPVKQRSCLILHFIEGYKYREIAELLGISEEAVRKRVTRGSLEFRRLYGSGGGLQ